MAFNQYMQDERRFGIQKLNSNNYHIWKQKMELLLIKDELWSVIASPIPEDPSDIWIQKDSKARSTLGLLVEDKYLVDLKHERRAIDIWRKLEKLHQRDIGSRLILYRSMFTAKYTGNISMSDHISTILDISSKLEDMGYPILPELLCSAILGSLPRDYNHVITAIEGRDAQDITVDYVREKLIEEEGRLRPHSPNTTRAFRTDRFQHQRKNTSNAQCFYCHKTGHLKKDCRLLKEHQSHQHMEGKRSNKNFSQSRRTSQNKTKMTTFEDEGNSQETREINTKTHLTYQHKALVTRTSNDKKKYLQWIVDTGAGSHMCKDSKDIDDIHDLAQPTIIITAGGEEHKVTQSGTANITVSNDTGELTKLTLNDVLLVPSLIDNLISVSKLDSEGYEVYFKQQRCWIAQSDKTYELGKLNEGLYINHTEIKKEVSAICKHIWHQRLAHRNTENITKMAEANKHSGLIITSCKNDKVCSVCQLTKKHNKSFDAITERKPDRPFHTVHADLCGPITPESMGHNKYALSIVDDYSRFATVYMLQHKNQTSQKIKEFIEAGINKFGRRPLIFRSDGGGEFENKQLNDYLINHGIKHRTSLPYTHQQNGIIEKHNRTLMEGTRALLKQSKLPKNLWGELANTNTYLNNLVTKPDQDKTPFELWNNEKPDYGHLRTIGTICYFLNVKPNKQKLDDRGQQGILVGYGHSKSFYRILGLNDNKIHTSRTVTFEDDKCPIQSEPCPFVIDLNQESQSPIERTIPEEEAIQAHNPELYPRKSDRLNRGKPPQILTYQQSGKPEDSIQDWYNEHKKSDTPGTST